MKLSFAFVAAATVTVCALNILMVAATPVTQNYAPEATKVIEVVEKVILHDHHDHHRHRHDHTGSHGGSKSDNEGDDHTHSHGRGTCHEAKIFSSPFVQLKSPQYGNFASAHRQEIALVNEVWALTPQANIGHLMLKPVKGTKPLWRGWSPTKKYSWTTSVPEYKQMWAEGYIYHGLVGYVFETAETCKGLGTVALYRAHDAALNQPYLTLDAGAGGVVLGFVLPN
ncbi:hypothetical protein HGRIS_000067 [Hohenbuehelia grisea]|uniref:Uncharacterized protein n=1 Tax=Hohenbuehelia grisea TaxID=104357 RepID=A0ABR3JPY1_9AGAR